MFFLSAFGALAASLVSTIRGEGPVFYEVIAIVLSIYTLGKTVGLQAKDNVWAQVRKLREAAGKATIIDAHGNLEERELKEVRVGQMVVIEAGQMITVDGVVREGRAYIAEAAMTGEPAPVPHCVGDRVLAGTYSLDGRLVIEVEKSLGERLLDDVLQVVE
jgi:P-type E1-E2 ATPase